MTVGRGYTAARESAAIFDRSARGKIAVAGADRRTYLHAMLTNDIASLQAGSGCYAAYLTPQGRMIADMTVLDLGDLILLDLDPAVTPGVLARLDQFVFSEDVKLGDLSQAFGKLVVAGPSAAAVVARVIEQADGSPLTAGQLAGWPPYRVSRGAFRGDLVVIAASDELGVPAFDLFVERPHLDDLAAALAGAGATGAEAAEWEVLRVEAGRPAFGADMDQATIPLEAGIEARAISLTKGCYPGQEVITRVLHRGRGRIARRIAALEVGGDQVPSPGDTVRSGDRDAGRVTSAVWSPRLGAPIALAMVSRDFFAAGTELDIVHGDRSLPARVVEPPFRPAAGD